ncbi:MAG: DUF433 domain-containing protein [Chloroflexi bacterium]|nr:MAG: hypothetical protein CUN54_03315 [Phototrophicales bacterium]RMF78805.1 MAG: DUF433 domain-containing protein [Chloroflexota bacterium]
MESINSINLIATNPSVRNGRPYIIGTTVTVTDIAIAKIYHQREPDEIAAWYDLSLPQVYAALAYYYQHKDALDEQIQAQIRRARELKDRRVGNEGSLLS